MDSADIEGEGTAVAATRATDSGERRVPGSGGVVLNVGCRNAQADETDLRVYCHTAVSRPLLFQDEPLQNPP